MRTLRSILFIFIVIMLAMNSGCKEAEPQEWSYDFTDKTDDSEWHLDPEYTGTHEVVFGQGLILNGPYLVTPVAFTGDFTMKVDFTVDVVNDTGIFFTFTIADEQDWEADNYIYACLDSIGWSGHEEWVVCEKGGGTTDYPISQTQINIPFLDREGPNSFEIVKVGNSYEFFMNGETIGNFNSKYCRGSQYYLKLHCAALLGGGIVYFKDVLVSCTGSII